jgi:peptidoglycan hydrolase-like protein with peptidoglycan-binding domain
MSATTRKVLTLCIGISFLSATTLATHEARAGGGRGAAIIGAGILGVAIGHALSQGLKPRAYSVPRQGSRSSKRDGAHDNVLAIQRALNAFGFDTGTPDGRMGRGTRAAIARYQQSIGEPATGDLTDGQQSRLLAAYAQRDQDKTAPTQTSKIDALFAAIGANPAAAAGATSPISGLGLPNVAGTAAVGSPTTMSALCRTDSMTAALKESAKAGPFDSKLVPDQFCVARTHVLAEAAETFKALSSQADAVKPELIRAECQRFAESKQAEVASLTGTAPAEFAHRYLDKAGGADPEREAAVVNSRICLGFGYADDKSDVVLASALVLVGLGETAYGEVIAASFATGIGVSKDVDRAVKWLEFAATQIEAGAEPLVHSDGGLRSKILRLVAKELTATPLATPARFDSSLGPKFSLPGGNAGKQGASRPAEPARALSRTDLVDQLRENVVFVYNGSGYGTGFFITPKHILTNAHVVENTEKVIVVNKSIRLRPALVRYRGMTAKSGGIDASILEVLDYSHPTFLKFAGEVREGEDIAIGGFPGRALEFDRGYNQFKELVAANQLPTLDQIPTTKFAFGVVQSVFTDNRTGLENVQEGLETTGGNSGSPVVNACGDVVALHYSGSKAFVESSGQSIFVDASKFNFAISHREVIKFLKAAGVTHQEGGATCQGG